MKRRPAQIIPLWFAVLLLAGCDLINPAEEIPAYLYVPDFTLETDPETEGSDSEKITEVWLTVNGDFLGAYDLPALIPVLAKGETQVRLDAGIKDNGVSSRPDIYPFYESWEGDLDLVAEEIDTIQPVIGYRDDTRFAFIEEFESEGHLFQEIRRGDADNRIQLTDTDVFEGNASGTFTVDTSTLVVEIATTSRFRDLTVRSPLVYLEVNYKSDVPVVFGLIGFDGQDVDGLSLFDPGFNPKGTWNKIYFNMSELAFQGGYNEHQVVLRAFIPIENGAPTRTTGRIWLDNIKLVHF